MSLEYYNAIYIESYCKRTNDDTDSPIMVSGSNVCKEYSSKMRHNPFNFCIFLRQLLRI